LHINSYVWVFPVADTDTPQEKEVEALTKKAQHLSDFGTLTSLVSTGAYMAEELFVKKLPRWLRVSTISAVGVGVAGIIASYYYRFKASALSKEADNKQSSQEPTTTEPAQAAEVKSVQAEVSLPKETIDMKWVKEARTSQDASTLQR
jgi:hypothetical protein